ncbi:hypothetical protein [Aquirhabdus sp.]|uniref:hypothetical protein n=1 Tax=Aquirhabdus sp. TaxID=2824160 RepID=UPI00396CFCC4
MATLDFTPVQALLGREVCFRDIAFEEQLEQYGSSFKDSEFFDEVSRSTFRYGRIAGCCADIGDSGDLDFAILLDEEYFHLSKVELLFVN